MRKTIYIDMDDTICQFSPGIRKMFKKVPGRKFPQSVPGFFENLEPIQDAIETVKRLSQENDVYILTAPSVRNPHSYTEKRIWIEKYFELEFCKKLIICSDKSLLRGDILIDDHINGKGQECFKGQVLQYGKKPFNNWQAIANYLLSA